jgi:hypothetical protein
MSPETPSEEDTHIKSKPPFTPPMYDATSDDYSISDGESNVLENGHPS